MGREERREQERKEMEEEKWRKGKRKRDPICSYLAYDIFTPLCAAIMNCFLI